MNDGICLGRVCLDQRPGIWAAILRWEREATRVEQCVDSLLDCLDFLTAQQFLKLREHCSVRMRQLLFEPAQFAQQIGGDWLPGIIPDDRAQFGLSVKAQPLVDRHDAGIAGAQAVPPLAIRVVGDDIEEGQSLKAVPEIGIVAEGEEVRVLVALDV